MKIRGYVVHVARERLKLYLRSLILGKIIMNENFLFNDIFSSATAKCRPGCALCEGKARGEEEGEKPEPTEESENE